MKTKTINEANGGFALYYGLGTLIPTIGGLIGLSHFFFDHITTNVPFVWWQFLLLLSVSLIAGVIAFILIRIGYAQVME